MRKHDYKVVFDKEEGLLWLVREIRERIGIEMYLAYKFDPITGLNPTGYFTTNEKRFDEVYNYLEESEFEYDFTCYIRDEYGCENNIWKEDGVYQTAVPYYKRSW